MVPVILMVVGAGLLLVGILFLIRIYLEPIRKAKRVVFKQDMEDYFYENEKGKKLEEESRKTLKTLCMFLVIPGIALFLIGFSIEYMPRGNAPIFAPSAEGMDTGEDSQAGVTSEPTGGEAAGGVPADYSILIKEDVIILNGEAYESVEAFEDAIKGLERGKKVEVKEDYAVSAIYHQVVELIKRYDLGNMEGVE